MPEDRQRLTGRSDTGNSLKGHSRDRVVGHERGGGLLSN
uniref:Uncharacterized protein n=1 Tax=Anguilla anguilla TaxID=7936 RepID=A0A0E9QXB4_ANGAN